MEENAHYFLLMCLSAVNSSKCRNSCVHHPKCDCLAAPWPAPAFFLGGEAPSLGYCFHLNNLWNLKKQKTINFPKRSCVRSESARWLLSRTCVTAWPRQDRSLTTKRCHKSGNMSFAVLVFVMYPYVFFVWLWFVDFSCFSASQNSGPGYIR